MRTKKSAVELSDLAVAALNRSHPEAKVTTAHVVYVPDCGNGPNWKVTGYGEKLPEFVIPDAGKIVAELQAQYDLDE